MKAALLHHVPLARTLSSYRRADARGDLVAGVTTAVMLIPQAMAYAMLAGLSPIVGLYASTVPLALYAVFGSSRELAVGPVAMVSLLVAAGVGGIAADPAHYLAYAVLLAGMVGVLQLIMGVARLGFVVNFLSHPVISGFTSAAALIIAASQLKHLLGISIPRSHYVHEVLLDASAALGSAHLPTLIIAAASVALLIVARRLAPMFPRALAVVVLGSLAVYLLGLAGEGGVAIVGTVPSGLPAPSLPEWDLAAMRELFPIALTIALVGFMESISVAKAFARKSGYHIDANQELVGLGAANIGAGLFGGYPVTGGFSRTAVNAQAGARSAVATLVTAAVVALAVAFFTPLFYYLPKAVLAAIIITAVVGLIDTHEVRKLYRTNRADLAMLAITFTATLALGIEIGILTGVAASIAWFVGKTTRPHTAVLGRLPGTTIYRNVERYPEVERFPGLLILRIDAPLYFGNATFIGAEIRRLLRRQPQPVRAVVLDAASVGHLDSSADAALADLASELAAGDIALFVAGATGPVRDAAERSGLRDRIGGDHFTRTVQEAVDAAQRAHLAAA